MRNPFPIVPPTVIMLCGVPGSGKSTWARNFVQSTPEYADSFVTISTDFFIELMAMKHNFTYDEAFAKYIGEATRRMEVDIANAVLNSKSIIWDQTNLVPKARKGKLNKLPQTYQKIAIWFDIPSDLQDRLDSRPGKTIPEPVMKTMLKQFTPPISTEGFHMVFNSEETV